MKNAILKFLISRAGSVLTPLVSLAIGAAVGKLSSLSPELAAQVNPVAVTGFVVTTLISLANYYTNATSGDGVKAIQAMVGVKQDGVPGPITYVEVRKATLP